MMLQPWLHHYIQQLTTLKRAPTRYGLAPHKPVLLLALIDLIEQQGLTENKMRLDASLLESYNRHWKLLVDTGHQPNIGLPIYHLQNDGFWTTVTRAGAVLDKPVSSEPQLLKQLTYGFFEQDFFALLLHPEYRSLFRMVLLDTYFPEGKDRYQTNLPSYFRDIELEVLEEAPAVYRSAEKTVEGFVRDWKFQHNIMRVYDHTCCISGLKVIPNFALIEACHIRPHATFGDNTIRNGIPLCVYLHRAFDAGLLSISDDYRVLISDPKTFKENDSPFSLRQFADKEILLPTERRYFPATEHLNWHRKRFGF